MKLFWTSILICLSNLQFSLSVVHPDSLYFCLLLIHYVLCNALQYCAFQQHSVPAMNLRAQMATAYYQPTSVTAPITVVTTVTKLAVVCCCNHDHMILIVIYLNTFSVCHVGDIQLTGTGSNVSKGNVELCILNQFNAICGNVWSSNDAKVVCRQLGFNSSKFTLCTVLIQNVLMDMFFGEMCEVIGL